MCRDGAPAIRAQQRRQRTVERLETAYDPEDDRGGWSEKDQEQRPQRGADELNHRVLASGGPTGELFSGRWFRHGLLFMPVFIQICGICDICGFLPMLDIFSGFFCGVIMP